HFGHAGPYPHEAVVARTFETRCTGTHSESFHSVVVNISPCGRKGSPGRRQMQQIMSRQETCSESFLPAPAAAGLFSPMQVHAPPQMEGSARIADRCGRW